MLAFRNRFSFHQLISTNRKGHSDPREGAFPAPGPDSSEAHCSDSSPGKDVALSYLQTGLVLLPESLRDVLSENVPVGARGSWSAERGGGLML